MKTLFTLSCLFFISITISFAQWPANIENTTNSITTQFFNLDSIEYRVIINAETSEVELQNRLNSNDWITEDQYGVAKKEDYVFGYGALSIDTTTNDFYCVIPLENDTTIIAKYDILGTAQWKTIIHSDTLPDWYNFTTALKGDSLIVGGGTVSDDLGLQKKVAIYNAETGEKIDQWFSEGKSDAESLITKVLNSSRGLLMLEAGYIDDSEYQSAVFGLGDDITERTIIEIKGEFIAHDLAHRGDKLYVFGNLEGDAMYYEYDINSGSITDSVFLWESSDTPIRGFTTGENIVTIHTSEYENLAPKGSGTKTLLYLFDGNNQKVDSSFLISELKSAEIMYAVNMIGDQLYICGQSVDGNMEYTGSYTAAIDIPNYVATFFKNRPAQEVIVSDGAVRFSDNSVIKRALWYDIQGRLLKVSEEQLNEIPLENNFVRPYLLVLESDKGKGVIRLSQQ